MVAVYLLGHKVGDIEEPVLYVRLLNTFGIQQTFARKPLREKMLKKVGLCLEISEKITIFAPKSVKKRTTKMNDAMKR